MIVSAVPSSSHTRAPCDHLRPKETITSHSRCCLLTEGLSLITATFQLTADHSVSLTSDLSLKSSALACTFSVCSISRALSRMASLTCTECGKTELRVAAASGGHRYLHALPLV